MWKEDAKKVVKLLKEKSFKQKLVYSFSPNLLVSSIYETRTHEQKVAISRSYNKRHQKDVLLTLN